MRMRKLCKDGHSVLDIEARDTCGSSVCTAVTHGTVGARQPGSVCCAKVLAHCEQSTTLPNKVV